MSSINKSNMNLFKQKKLFVFGLGLTISLSPLNAHALFALLNGVDSKTVDQWETEINNETDATLAHIEEMLVSTGQLKKGESYVNSDRGQIARLNMIADNWHSIEAAAIAAFDKSDKSHLPIASKDSEGNYFLDLTSPYKAVTITTRIGSSPFSLDVLRYTLKAINTEKKLSSFTNGTPTTVLTPKSIYNPLTSFQIDIVASELGDWENVASGQSWATRNHGGTWIGAQTIEWGGGYNSQMTICNQTATLWLRALIWDGQPQGYKSQFWINTCQAGTIKTSVVSTNGTIWKDEINFY